MSSLWTAFGTVFVNEFALISAEPIALGVSHR